MRVHTVGEMSAALAHEITQPLGAIENYAHAARRRLSGPAPDLPKVVDLLERIVAQSARAGDVVTRLRGMVKYEGLDPAHADSVRTAYRDRAPKQRVLRLDVTRTVSWDHAKIAAASGGTE